MAGVAADAGSAAAAALFSVLALAILRRWHLRLPHAAPNARTLHAAPVPRVGGLAIWAGVIPVAAALGLARPSAAGAALAGAWALLLAVSLYDDWHGLSAAARLPLQLVAAGVAVAALPAGPASAFGGHTLYPALAVLAVGWSANAYNFMDGTDGLAALMALTGFGAYAAAATGAASPAASLYWALLGATLPFAAVNWPPARMFMGDCGAVPLGFVAAVAGLGEWARGTWPGWFPLLVFLPFLADASATLLRRLARGERVWEAHRSHYYQRWHQLGAGHAGTLARYGVLMVGTALSALATLAIEPQAGWIVLAAWGVVLGLVFGRIDYHWRHRSSPPA